jgi:hypothetical protein
MFNIRFGARAAFLYGSGRTEKNAAPAAQKEFIKLIKHDCIKSDRVKDDRIKNDRIKSSLINGT